MKINRHRKTDTETPSIVRIGIYKERIYIDDVTEIPPGAKLQEGQRGGLYYESGEQSEFAQFQINTDAERMEEYDFDKEDIDGAVETLQDVHDKSEDIFATWMETVENLGADVEFATHRTKSVGSALEKVHERQPEQYDDVEELTDLHGSMIVLDDVQEAKQIAETIEEQADTVKVNNYFGETDQPYRAVNIKAEVEGVTAELQVKQKELKEVGDASHSLVMKPNEAPVDEMNTLDTPPSEELQDMIDDCLTEQANFIVGETSDVDCEPQATAVIEEYYALH